MPLESVGLEFEIRGLSATVQAIQQIGRLVGNLQPIGTAASAATQLYAFQSIVGAVVSAVQSLRSAVQSLMELVQQATQLGGSPDSASRAIAIGLLGGFDPATLARGIRERVSAGGIGSALGAQMGLPFAPLGFGIQIEEGQYLNRTLRYLVDLMRQGPAGMAQARMIGAEIPQAGQLLGIARAIANMSESQRIEAFANLNEQSRRLTEALDANAPQAAILAGHFADLRIELLGLSTAAITFVNWLIDHMAELTGLIGLFSPGGAGLGGVPNALREWFAGHKTALDRNTEALQGTTAALNQSMLPEGTFGGGPRARGAIPGAFTGPGMGTYLNDAFLQDANRLGAYTPGL